MTDVVAFGSDKPPWRPSRRLVAAALALAVAGLGLAVLLTRGGDENPDGGEPPAPVAHTPSGCTGSAPASERTGSPVPGRTGSPAAGRTGSPAAVTGASPVAIVIEGACHPGAGLDRRDTTAATGPWTVVVRGEGGSLGRDGAVVTYPVPREGDGPGKVVKRLGDTYARVRGDLAPDGLKAIADSITVSGGRPVVRPPRGMSVVATGTYRPASIHEIRYGTAELGEQAALGSGLTFTGVAAAGGYEDHLYATGDLSSVFGGNGAIAWEPKPGLIAFIGYSGATRTAAADEALQRLAGRARAINGDGWRALAPTVAGQSNDIP
ncbi:hypothetical protein AB0J83_00255 [Actinoplanes sp. NPDC049596]|uniref:hypothetical protein n=1 Tax=Actinoplanes sp. NPDC049596 TaxID=3154625 RepID=UPI00342D286B